MANAASDAMESNLFIQNFPFPAVSGEPVEPRLSSVGAVELRSPFGSTGSALTDYISNILSATTLTRHYRLRKPVSRIRGSGAV